MAKVNITINGRRYALGCDDGEEERLSVLGQKLDNRIKDLANQFGQIGDLRLLVMAGITMMDELEDTDNLVEQKAERLAADVRRASEDAVNAARRQQSEASKTLLGAAKRIQSIANKIDRAQ
ncbi:MAG: cell division protein ZapA [Hellea sp.]|nr:cell division protein ZapA [Hellea sp.]